MVHDKRDIPTSQKSLPIKRINMYTFFENGAGLIFLNMFSQLIKDFCDAKYLIYHELFSFKCVYNLYGDFISVYK
jgi:hypothetical protein